MKIIRKEKKKKKKRRRKYGERGGDLCKQSSSQWLGLRRLLPFRQHRTIFTLLRPRTILPAHEVKRRMACSLHGTVNVTTVPHLSGPGRLLPTKRICPMEYDQWRCFRCYTQVSDHAAEFSSVQGGIYALGKAHKRSTPSFTSFPNAAFETVPMFV